MADPFCGTYEPPESETLADPLATPCTELIALIAVCFGWPVMRPSKALCAALLDHIHTAKLLAGQEIVTLVALAPLVLPPPLQIWLCPAESCQLPAGG